jgi:E3 ubiquitin-protein ligase NEDD4
MHLTDKLFLVVAADGSAKLGVFSLPDPFAVIIVDSEQTHTTSVIKKTLNPYWNGHFDVFVVLLSVCPVLGSNFLRPTPSMVKGSSVVTVQIFDQRKFKRRDQGFLGFVEIRVTDYLDLEPGGQGMFSGLRIAPPL